MVGRRLLLLIPGVLALCACVSPLSAQTSKSTSSRAKKTPVQTLERFSAQDRITLPSGESVSVSDIVPRSEDALRQLQNIVSAVRPADIDAANASLSILNRRVAEGKPGAESTIRLARSALQLTDVRLEWNRNRAQLEAIKLKVSQYSSSLAAQQTQLPALRDLWLFLASPEINGKLPPELNQRVNVVVDTLRSTEASVQSESERLVSLQVVLADTSAEIADVTDQLEAADAALRDQIFVLDSPPLLTALREADFRQGLREMTELTAGSTSHVSRFYGNNGSNLLLYVLFVGALFLAITRISRVDLSTVPLKFDETALACLKRPVATTFLLSCVIFVPVFAKAPLEVQRLVRLLTIIPVIHVALGIVMPELRSYVSALGLAFAINVVSVQLTSGTVLRRIIALILSVAISAALVRLLRRGGLLHTIFERDKAVVLPLLLRFSCCLLLIAIVCAVIGNASLADLLANGTILGLYYSLSIYTLTVVMTALTAAFLCSSVAQRSRAVRLHASVVNAKVSRSIRAGGFVFWSLVLLYAFQISQPTFDSLGSVLQHKWKLGTINLSLLDIVLFGLVLLASSLLAKLIRFLLNEEILPRTSINTGVAQAGSRLTYIFLLTLGMFLALGAAGLELSKLTVLTGAFGVGLGFGLQNVVSNFVSGIILSLERPVQIGDLLEINNVAGEVTVIGFRSSTIRTFDGADVIVPNSDLITKSVINWSLTDYLRRTDIKIGTAYGTDPERVIAILTRVVNAHPLVVRRPEPLITFDEFGDSALIFTARFWSRLDQRIQVRSEINMHIAAEFENASIAIPFPQRDIHLFVDDSGEKSALAATLSTRQAKAGGTSS